MFGVAKIPGYSLERRRKKSPDEAQGATNKSLKGFKRFWFCKEAIVKNKERKGRRIVSKRETPPKPWLTKGYDRQGPGILQDHQSPSSRQLTNSYMRTKQLLFIEDVQGSCN
ncbi:unnamed protein product [Caenorhabditis brenneri]